MFRTIRRKLFVVLCLVFCMLLTMAGSGISGLMAFRSVVRDLDHGINVAPHQADLHAALGRLFGPLLLDPKPDGVTFQQRQFLVQLAETEGKVRDFRDRLERMPTTEVLSGRKFVTDPLLAQIDHRLDELRQMQLANPDPHQRDVTLHKMLREVAQLQILAQRVPDPVQGLFHELDEARRVYRSMLIVLFVAAGVVLVLFAGLILCGRRWIFKPICQLHEGARRVAQGDFNYRLRLKSRDEMGDLADAFNMMTDRFQETTCNLDSQVRERSKQLVRSERLAGVGFLAAGVAHEINNPLSAIQMAAESLESRLQPSTLEVAVPEDAGVIHQYLQMIQRESDRCRHITGKLLDFARGQDSVRSRTDVTELVVEVLDMVQHLGKYRGKQIEFARRTPCYLEVNGPEIKQVILNLVANALESTDAAGRLQIDVTEQIDQVSIAFQDDGCGMTPDVIDNLFEPFFTRKREGQGTGLGLSISHRIIAEHGGTIEAVSDGPGHGSTFRLRLPRRAVQAGAAA